MPHPSPGRWPPSPRFAGRGVITKRLRHYPSPRDSGEKVPKADEGRFTPNAHRARRRDASSITGLQVQSPSNSPHAQVRRFALKTRLELVHDVGGERLEVDA